MAANFYFRGMIRPYLQGRNALDVTHQSPGFLECYLGSKRTRIRLRDFRLKVRQSAERALDGQDAEQFAGIFSQPAKAKIRLTQGKVQIDLHDGVPEQAAPMLWLGVVKDGESIPLTSVHWEVFRAVGKSRTGFAMLMPDE